MSANRVLITVVELEVFVRVATKLKSSHCTGATSLQFTLLPVGVVLVLDSIISRNEWVNNPLHSNSLVDSAGVSHHLSRTGLPHTHTGVQDNSSWMQDSIGMFLALRRNYIAARWENLPPPILCDVMQLDCLVV